MADLAYYKSDTLDYLFNAQSYEKETGLYHYFARQYDPTIGRWNNVDPLADRFPMQNPYRFCFNNPLKYIDRLGMVEENGETQKSGGDGPKEGEMGKDVFGRDIIFMGGQWTYLLDSPTISTPPFWKFYSAYTFYGYAYNFGDRGFGFAYDMPAYSYLNRGGGVQKTGRVKDSDGNVYSVNAGFAWGGGIGIEIGIVTDKSGAWRWFFSASTNLGAGLGLGVNVKDIHSVDGHTFSVNDYAGYSSNWSGTLGITTASYGGNNYENKLLSDFGKTYTEIGIGVGAGSPVGLMKSYSKTWFLK